MTIDSTLWTTVECSAWSRGFDYSGYLDLHHKVQCKGTALTEAGYGAIYRMFEDEMVATFKKEGWKG